MWYDIQQQKFMAITTLLIWKQLYFTSYFKPNAYHHSKLHHYSYCKWNGSLKFSKGEPTWRISIHQNVQSIQFGCLMAFEEWMSQWIWRISIQFWAIDNSVFTYSVVIWHMHTQILRVYCIVYYSSSANSAGFFLSNFSCNPLP